MISYAAAAAPQNLLRRSDQPHAAFLAGRPMTTRSHPQRELADLPLHEAAELVRSRAVSPVELTRACLARIEELNPQLNAFITVTADAALAQARAAEQEIAAGAWRGPLHGIPIAAKDIIDVAGVRTTAASRLFADRVA